MTVSEAIVNEAVGRIVGKSLAESLLEDGSATLAKATLVMDPIHEASEYVQLAYAEVRAAQDKLLAVEVALEKALTKFGLTVDGE